jgi:transposase-like protein
MKPILEHAIEIEGSRVALARAMGVAPSVVTYWAHKLPRRREDQLVKLYGKRKRKEWTK